MASTCVTDTRFLPKRVSKKSVCNPEQRRRVQGSGDRALLSGGRRFFDYAQNHYGLGKAAQGDENNGSSVVKPGGGFETRHYGSAYFHCNDMGGALRMTVAPPGITMALLRPHEVMKLVHCLLLGSCTCRAYPPPPTTPWVPAFAGTTSAGAVSLAGYFHSDDKFCLLRRPFLDTLQGRALAVSGPFEHAADCADESVEFCRLVDSRDVAGAALRHDVPLV